MFGQESLCYGNLMDLCLALITEAAEERGDKLRGQQGFYQQSTAAIGGAFSDAF